MDVAAVYQGGPTVLEGIRSRLTYANVIATIAVFAALGLGGLSLDVSHASAGQVSCGDEITADTTLDGDLVNCENNGIVIGADDITLDLNGYRIEGDGTEFPGCDPMTELCDFGIANEGHDGVTVRDGSARQFGIGVLVAAARGNRVLNISSSRNDFFGAVVGGSSRSVIRGGSFSRNIAPEGDGIGLFGSDHVRIVGNQIRRNPGPGMHVFNSTHTLIKGNLFLGNGPGILLEGDHNQVRQNRSVRDGGFLNLGNRNVIARNRVSQGGDIAIEKGHGNRIARNVVVGARGRGIRLGLDQPEQLGGGHNVVLRNRVRGSARAGFLVAGEDDHSVLRRNVAVGAGGDGFRVSNPSTQLTRNRAMRNADFGIEAVSGVIDGGGNRAHGNGNPAQCVNVAC